MNPYREDPASHHVSAGIRTFALAMVRAYRLTEFDKIRASELVMWKKQRLEEQSHDVFRAKYVEQIRAAMNIAGRAFVFRDPVADGFVVSLKRGDRYKHARIPLRKYIPDGAEFAFMDALDDLDQKYKDPS